MPRRPRLDAPGTWHHVLNRGLAKRPLFESRNDARFFLAELARQVRAGRIELHAFCLMTTHFHLLVRSPIGMMSEAMRRAQNTYSRRFNRLRRRDGALIRGRFLSRPVDTDEYLCTLVRYIDNNPVRAGLAAVPEEYELGSARHYFAAAGPCWLTRSHVEGQAVRLACVPQFSAEAYRTAFDISDSPDADSLAELVEARMAARVAAPAPEDLLAAAGVSGRRWMAWKTRLADGLRPGLPACTPRALRRALNESLQREKVWMVEDGRRTWRGADLAWHGLLYGLCGLSHRKIAELHDGSVDRARRLCNAHCRLLRDHERYAERAMEIGRRAVMASLQPRSRSSCGTTTG